MEIDSWREIEWRIEPKPISYESALETMTLRAKAIRAGEQSGLIWCLEHPPIYTAGTSAKASDLINPNNLPVYEAGRGGQYTYHGPGQRVVYLILDLKAWKQDVRAYVQALENWIMLTLKDLGIIGQRRCARIGVWVERDDLTPIGREDKIAAIGVRLKQWVTMHGIAINLNPNLMDYQGIIPCGIHEALYGVTSLHDLGIKVDYPMLDGLLKANFAKAFDLSTQPNFTQNL